MYYECAMGDCRMQHSLEKNESINFLEKTYLGKEKKESKKEEARKKERKDKGKKEKDEKGTHIAFKSIKRWKK